MTDQQMECWEAEVSRNIQLAKEVFEIEISCPFDVRRFLPGQFVSIAPLAQSSCLSRPFSLYKTSNTNFGNFFSIMVRTVGKNFELLSELKQGMKIKVWGPLGNGFVSESYYDEVWLVGGGIGIAPLCLFDKLISAYQRRKCSFFYGDQSKDKIIPLRYFTEANIEIATDDGSFGFPGFITELFSSYHKKTFRISIVIKHSWNSAGMGSC